ncbi:DUF58 domain-containing protein [Persephonella sp. IF05-L8]|uniref:DUF58 domain-containing protein n=1 Tax=Persephonella sp. IF05-L8 TaxID=1158338 RepID=UPI00055C4B23
MIKITKAGWIYIGLTIFLGVAAVNTGNNLVYLIVSAMLSFMGISGFFGRKNIDKLQIELKFPEEIYADVETPVKIVIKNQKRFLPSFLLKISINNQKSVVPYIDPSGEFDLHLTLKYNRRGWHTLEFIEVCSVFPFNFFTRCKETPVNQKFIIFPKPEKCNLLVLYTSKKSVGDYPSDIIGTQGELLSIKDYSPGDPLKLVHWKATAKTGQLKTKELTEETVRPVLIDFDNVNIPNVEKRISCITYSILQMYKEGIPFGLKIGSILFPPEFSTANKVKILTALAEYGTE